MFNNKWFHSFTPKGFLWKITLLNSMVIALAMGITGWAIYETACKLVDGFGGSSSLGNIQFNATLFQYFLIFTISGILLSIVLHYYLTKKLMQPIRELISSTKTLKSGHYPAPIQLKSSDEMAELIEQYNDLINRLKHNEEERKKLIENISHELRTPTANIKGYLYALKEGDITGDDKLFESLHHQAEQLTNLIEQVDSLQLWHDDRQHTNQEIEVIDSRELIDESLQLFHWQMKQEDIQVTKDVEKSRLSVNKYGMQQVLSNLIENAILYGINDKSIKIVGKIDKQGYAIEVVNEGEPITEQDKQYVFDRFYRVDYSRSRKTGGSGLGLAIAKEIVRNHGGTIELETKGNLHTFKIWIPVNKD